MDKLVKEVLQEKGAEVYTIDKDSTVYDALAKMAEANIGALVIVDERDKVVGVLSERDYARKVILKGISSLNTPVHAIMEKNVYYATPSHTVEECMALMTETRYRHLPVLDNGRLIGLISIGDMVKATIKAKEFIIDQLTNYIKSG